MADRSKEENESVQFHMDELENWFLQLVTHIEGAEFHSISPFAHLHYTGTHVWNGLLFFPGRVTTNLIETGQPSTDEARKVALKEKYRQALLHVTDFFDAKKRNFDIYIPTNIAFRAELLEIVKQNNARLWGAMVCMEVDLVQWTHDRVIEGPGAPSELIISEVLSDDRRMLEKYWAIVARSFLQNEEAAYYSDIENNGDAFVRPLWRRWIGRWNGEPVATISLSLRMAERKTGFIYDVATLETARKRGFGTQMLKHVLKEAYETHNLATVALQGEPDGVGIYERQGFQRQCEVEIYEYVKWD